MIYVFLQKYFYDMDPLALQITKPYSIWFSFQF